MSVELSFLGLQRLDLKWRLEDEKKKIGFFISTFIQDLGHSKNSFLQ